MNRDYVPLVHIILLMHFIRIPCISPFVAALLLFHDAYKRSGFSNGCCRSDVVISRESWMLSAGR
jgi:uncharacterized membrane protein